MMEKRHDSYRALSLPMLYLGFRRRVYVGFVVYSRYEYVLHYDDVRVCLCCSSVTTELVVSLLVG